MRFSVSSKQLQRRHLSRVGVMKEASHLGVHSYSSVLAKSPHKSQPSPHSSSFPVLNVDEGSKIITDSQLFPLYIHLFAWLWIATFIVSWYLVQILTSYESLSWTQVLFSGTLTCLVLANSLPLTLFSTGTLFQTAQSNSILICKKHYSLLDHAPLLGFHPLMGLSVLPLWKL